MTKLAVILIRGLVGLRADIKDTLFSLNLRRKHTCAIIEDTDVTQGMLKKVADFVTYGEVSQDTLKLLSEKRKQSAKELYFLNPPKGGFERKGIKRSFSSGGALGYRKDAINDLLKRMM